MKYFTLALTLLLVGLFSSTATAQTGAIAGTVKDDNNNPVKEFTVRLNIANKATVDFEKGTFLFSALAAGTYTIEIKAPGFETFLAAAKTSAVVLKSAKNFKFSDNSKRFR